VKIVLEPGSNCCPTIGAMLGAFWFGLSQRSFAATEDEEN
jgi:hypothetical protein